MGESGLPLQDSHFTHLGNWGAGVASDNFTAPASSSTPGSIQAPGLWAQLLP